MSLIDSIYDVAHAVPAVPAVPARPLTMLYIEDNTANLALVAQLIGRRSDIRLLSASTGRDGIALAQSELPQVILMDINLPDINGLTALKLLREYPTTRHIPVVALSSDAYPRQIASGIAAGFFRYLTKPFRIDELMSALDAGFALSEQRARTLP